MDATSGPGAAVVLPTLLAFLRAVEHLCFRGVEPQKAIAVVVREFEIPELAAVMREAWAFATAPGGSGPTAVVGPLVGLLNVADTLRSIGVEPVDVLPLVKLPPGLAAMMREALTVAGSGGVVGGAWSFAAAPDGSGAGAAAVNDALSRLLTIADKLRSIGVEPPEVIHVLQRANVPPRLVAVVRAAWAFAVGLDDDEDVGA